MSIKPKVSSHNVDIQPDVSATCTAEVLQDSSSTPTSSDRAGVLNMRPVHSMEKLGEGARLILPGLIEQHPQFQKLGWESAR